MQLLDTNARNVAALFARIVNFRRRRSYSKSMNCSPAQKMLLKHAQAVSNGFKWLNVQSLVQSRVRYLSGLARSFWLLRKELNVVQGAPEAEARWALDVVRLEILACALV